jgi:3,4-dihydroxy 2-butanone 4-phosphate synthase/GTP cyclohydrolase II
MPSTFSAIPELIECIRRGEMVILIDDEDRENEGDLVFAADFVTPEKINFMAKEARGLICLTLTEKQTNQLSLPLMVPNELNGAPNKTAFTLSIEAAEGVSTGISAADRSRTIWVASRPNANSSQLSSPGHVFPIRANPGGVRARAGHTEASVELAQLAGLTPAAVICELINDDGTMSRTPQLLKFAEKFNLKVGLIKNLIDFVSSNEAT